MLDKFPMDQIGEKTLMFQIWLNMQAKTAIKKWTDTLKKTCTISNVRI